jgi:phosphoribosylformimino-5-aminoimidazole carboxamide ribotide isomerase
MIIPAIDLIGGRCVRLYKGDFNQRSDYEEAPIDVAKSFAAQGAKRMHVVDLDGAKHGNSEQIDLIIELSKESGLAVQTGGGIRELSQIQRLLDGGVDRVVVGSLSVTNPQMVKFWINEVGADKIVIALDVNLNEEGTPIPATRGWTEAGEKSLWHVLDDYSGSGLKTVLITDIGRDGVLGGSNVDLYKDVQSKYPTLNLITSGGVGTLDDVKALKALNPHGIIIGKALYENRFNVADAVAC